MDLYSIITAVLLLQLQGFHVAFLQAPTNSPGRTIDQNWLRQLFKSKLNKTSEAPFNVLDDMNQEGTESTDDSAWGITDGYMSSSGEQDDIQDTNETSGDVMIGTTLPPELPDATAEDPESPATAVESPETTVAPEPPVSVALNSSQVSNATGEDSGLQTTTTTPITENSNGSNYMSNDTELNETTTAPDTNSTDEAGPDPDVENGVTNSTEDSHNVTTAVPEGPEPSSEPSTASPTTKLPLDSPGTTTAKIIPETTTTTGPSTTTDMMETGAASGNNSARGLASDAVQNKKKSEAWGAILGTGVAVCFVAMVVFVIWRRRGRRDFTHMKLVEEFPSDPVQQLDNSEPLDLKYDGSAYYNPGCQMDNIQMANFPRGHQN
ncbi:mucin-15-like [Oncorhynchus tshawytscha]|uniref:Mucin-15 n=1 Tax=Oncorhynchus tshawytscha TaxID=74940 RepID=A0A8C8GN97_ONCTS|nr:mucin-15-like [Oncorhynchus tshawytscha]